ncbi:MAG: HDOD domain-containing protein [Alteromonadaceae bacterium]|nr:HDOD domain-containing protein [Alteromonadaceae bacterium]
MQIFLENDNIAPIYQRMLSLRISKEFASTHSGKGFKTLQENTEQDERGRELLAIEQEAQKNKIIAEHGERHFREQISSQLFSRIDNQVNEELDNNDLLFSKTLIIEDSTTAALDILAVRAASIRRIRPLIANLTWLADDLISLVNKPQYRKRADVQISDINVAVSYVGLDNLKLVLPTFILKHYLPHSTSPFALMKRKLWNESLSIALATSVLANAANVDEYSAFTAAMFSNMGQLAVCKIYLNSFFEIHGEDIRAAYQAKDKRLHDVLLSIKVPADLLLTQLTQRSAKISADMMELMNFERLPLTEPLFDLAYTLTIEKMHPIAQLIVKAQAYVAFRSLAKESLITTDEAKLLFTAAKLNNQDIALLKKSDIDHLKLKFN